MLKPTACSATWVLHKYCFLAASQICMCLYCSLFRIWVAAQNNIAVWTVVFANFLKIFKEEMKLLEINGKSSFLRTMYDFHNNNNAQFYWKFCLWNCELGWSVPYSLLTAVLYYFIMFVTDIGIIVDSRLLATQCHPCLIHLFWLTFHMYLSMICFCSSVLWSLCPSHLW